MGTATGDTQITVRYYAAASAAAGLDTETVPLTAATSIQELADRLATRHGPELSRVLTSASFLIDGVAGGTERIISAGVTVDVLPPFAGG